MRVVAYTHVCLELFTNYEMAMEILKQKQLNVTEEKISKN